MRKHHKQHHPTRKNQQETRRFAYLLAVGNSGVEVVGTAYTHIPSRRTVAYGLKDQYGFFPVGHAVISRDLKWKKRGWEVPTYFVKELA